MELDYQLENLDAVEESVKGLYTQHTEGNESYYTLNVKGVKPQDEFDKVYNTLGKVRKEREDFERSLKAFGEYTPESIKAIVDENETLKAVKNTTSEEEFQKRFEESKLSWAKENEALKHTFDLEKEKYEALIAQKEQENTDMRLENALQGLYAKNGDPTGISLAIMQAKKDLKWNPDMKEFVTHDGIFKMKDWLEESLFKNYPCLLKQSLSGGARGSDSSTASYDKWFNPKTPGYDMTPGSEFYVKQLDLFRKDPKKYDELKARYAPK